MSAPAATLLHVFPTFDLGGAQRRTVQLVNHFGREFRHCIIPLDGQAGAMQMLAGDLDASILPIDHGKGRTWRNARLYRRILDEVKPDLLVTSNWGSIEWAMANFDARYRHLHMEDGFGPEEANRQLPRRVWTRRLILRRATVMAPSMRLYRLALDVWRLPKRHVTYIPNGIDCQRFGRVPDPAFASSFGIALGRATIGTVAALRREKNLARLLDAFAAVARSRPAQLVIIGDGPERSRLEAHANELGIAADVVFTGNCNSPERLLPSLDLFVLSSDTEQMPISLLEAMAAGRPVAATDVGDVKQMVAPDNQPFVVAKDAEALAAAMESLLAEPARAAIIGEANFRRAREVYGEERMFASYHALFTGIGDQS